MNQFQNYNTQPVYAEFFVRTMHAVWGPCSIADCHSFASSRSFFLSLKRSIKTHFYFQMKNVTIENKCPLAMSQGYVFK